VDAEISLKNGVNCNTIPFPTQPPTTTSADLYEMPLSVDNITLISSLVHVEDFCKYINIELESNSDPLIAGFDAEWRPIGPKLSCAALLQIAFINKVFLVDIVSLKKCDANEQKEAYKSIMQSFFANEVESMHR